MLHGWRIMQTQSDDLGTDGSQEARPPLKIKKEPDDPEPMTPQLSLAPPAQSSLQLTDKVKTKSGEQITADYPPDGTPGLRMSLKIEEESVDSDPSVKEERADTDPSVKEERVDTDPSVKEERVDAGPSSSPTDSFTDPEYGDEHLRDCKHTSLALREAIDDRLDCVKCEPGARPARKITYSHCLQDGKKYFRCDECGKSFAQLGTLKIHMRIHTGEKPYACNFCGKTFSQRQHLIVHKRTHTGERPYKCDDCGKTFARHDTLSRHKATHSGERRYRCEKCRKTFKRRNCMISHERTHTSERPYKCDDCGKAFVQRTHMIAHKRTHTDDRPYKCDCGKSFSQRSHMVRHIRIMH